VIGRELVSLSHHVGHRDDRHRRPGGVLVGHIGRSTCAWPQSAAWPAEACRPGPAGVDTPLGRLVGDRMAGDYLDAHRPGWRGRRALVAPTLTRGEIMIARTITTTHWSAGAHSERSSQRCSKSGPLRRPRATQQAIRRPVAVSGDPPRPRNSPPGCSVRGYGFKRSARRLRCGDPAGERRLSLVFSAPASLALAFGNASLTGFRDVSDERYRLGGPHAACMRALALVSPTR
jgi:hypothetical protein